MTRENNSAGGARAPVCVLFWLGAQRIASPSAGDLSVDNFTTCFFHVASIHPPSTHPRTHCTCRHRKGVLEGVSACLSICLSRGALRRNAFLATHPTFHWCAFPHFLCGNSPSTDATLFWRINRSTALFWEGTSYAIWVSKFGIN